MKKLLTILLLMLILPSIAGLVVAQDDTIAEIIEDHSEADDAEFTILLELLEESDLAESLDDDVEFTLFAPTDEAFEDLFDELDIDLDELLDDVELLMDILLYHMIEDIVESDDLEDEQEIETLQGGIITVTIDDESIILNDSAEVLDADIEASNGVIHIIDAVLIPVFEGGETCFISTDTSNGASVHVGPGNNRTSVTFLNTGSEYEALGQNEDSDGTIWYQLDKEEAAPGRAINEAWVSSAEVDITGDCDNIGEISAPPIIPITNRQPPATSSDNDSGDNANSNPVDTANTGSRPSSGTYSVSLATFTNASCAGGRNIPIPSVDFWTSTVFSTVVNTLTSSITFNGDVLTFSNGVYNGQILLDGEYYTTTVYPSNSGFFTGTIIVSFVSSGQNCSGSVNFSASR